jgi:hypothetical protein
MYSVSRNVAQVVTCWLPTAVAEVLAQVMFDL